MASKRTVQCLLFFLSVVVFLDRISISLAGPRMQHDLSIPPQEWGWVLGVFAIGYAGFEIPSGILGDRIGPRRVLTRIVLWWSAFTSLTGAATTFSSLIAFRFLFGVGEAGAYPNAAIVISRWFAVGERGRAHGLMFLGAQIGGILAPLIIIPLQLQLGWRVGFLLLGGLGVVWVLAWRLLFSKELPPCNATPTTPATLNWTAALRNPGVWCLALTYLLYCYAGFFYISWFPTFLMRARGFREKDLLFTVFPPAAGAVAYVLGGYSNDFLIRTCGLRWGPRILGLIGFGISLVSFIAMMVWTGRTVTVVFFTIAAGGLSLIVPSAWAVCVDLAGPAAGSLTGFMNTAGQIGSFLSTVLFGLIVSRLNSYEAPIAVLCVVCAIGGMLWFGIDGSTVIEPVALDKVTSPKRRFR